MNIASGKLIVLVFALALAGCGGGSSAPQGSPVGPSTPPAPPTVASSYKITIFLPPPGGFGVSPQAINDAGQVAGYVNTAASIADAVIWDHGTVTDLGPGYGYAINNSGTVAGYMLDADDGIPIATVWQNGTFVQIGRLPGLDSSQANGINDAGEVVGVAYSFLQPDMQQAFSWTEDGGLQAIPDMETALAINGNRVAGMRDNGTRVAVIQDLGAPTSLGIEGVVSAVNSKGQATGFTDSPLQAFFWDGVASVTLIGQFSGTGINDSDIIVGDAGATAAKPGRFVPASAQTPQVRFIGGGYAVAWSATDGIIDLNTRVSTPEYLGLATGINKSGSIVGTSNLPDQVPHGFLLEAQ